MAAPTRIQTLSIGSQTLSAATFARAKNNSLVLESFEFEPMPGEPPADAGRGPQVRPTLESLADSCNLKLPTRYALSGQAVFTRFVKLPAVEESKVGQMVEFEAQQNVPFPINEVEWDYKLIDTPGADDLEVALVAIKTEALNQINSVVEEAGFQVEAVDVAPMALINALRYNYPELSDPVMLIDIGSRSTNLVFTEATRLFSRTLPVGGAAVTLAIAKELAVPFADAEARKIEAGFVALGGNYEENPDPDLAALGRVSRTAMSRLHAEIVRTINYYRSTIGGSKPVQVMLCGGGAALPYTKEFFEEKLGLPVEYFNPLRMIGLSPSIAEQASAVAYRLGDHVGLALRTVGSCPVEIDLKPTAVAFRRELCQRKPVLTAGAVALMAGFAAWAGQAYFGAATAQSELQELRAERDRVEEVTGRIQIAREARSALDETRAPLVSALQARSVWPGVLDFLNREFASDVLWVTDVDPLLLDGTSVIRSESTPRAAARPAAGGDGEAEAPPNAIGGLQLRGLWRASDNDPVAGQNEVRRIYQALGSAEGSPFDAERMSAEEGDRLRIPSPDEESLAWPFTMRLPLANPISLD